jgi:hypothetical protein
MAVSGGFGAVWKITVTSTLTTVANVEDIEFPTTENELDEITAHDSPGGYEEFVATGIKRSGEFQATLTWDVAEATHAELVDLQVSGASNAMTLATPGTAESLAFTGIVRNIERQSPIGEALRAVVTIKVNGAIVIT